MNSGVCWWAIYSCCVTVIVAQNYLIKLLSQCGIHVDWIYNYTQSISKSSTNRQTFNNLPPVNSCQDYAVHCLSGWSTSWRVSSSIGHSIEVFLCQLYTDCIQHSSFIHCVTGWNIFRELMILHMRNCKVGMGFLCVFLDFRLNWNSPLCTQISCELGALLQKGQFYHRSSIGCHGYQIVNLAGQISFQARQPRNY